MNRVQSKRTWVVLLVGLAVLVQMASGAAEPNGVFPNDPLFPEQWYLHNTGQNGGTPGVDINAIKAREITTGDPNIVIALIDTGVDSTHPDLIDNLVPGYDFLQNDAFPDPARNEREDTHGTMCAGTVAAKGNNGVGVAGVAYDCRIMSVRHGSATKWISWDKEATALRWAAAQGADVIIWSSGGGSSGVFHSAVKDVTAIGGIGREGRGCVVCLPAGNNTKTTGTSSWAEIIAVGATDNHDVRWPYSAYGRELDLVAPSGCDNIAFGGSVVSFWTTDMTGPLGHNVANDDPTVLDYAQYVTGTSVSCPIVAGVAALVLSIEPNLTSEEVRHYLCRSAKDLGEPGRDDYYGWGRVDARAALDMVLAKRADLNNDWVVDEHDLALLTAAMKTNDRLADIAPAARRDGLVDEKDRALLRQYLGMEIPEPGLLAHWRLDEHESSVARSSVSSYQGVLRGDPCWQPTAGRKAGALLLDGVDDYLETPALVNPSERDTAFSIFLWVKGGTPGQVIVSQKDQADWLLAEAGTGVLMTDLKGTWGGKPLSSAAVVTDSQWHEVGLVYDGISRILYVDGIEAARDTQSYLAGALAPLYVGADHKLAPGTFWSGLIDSIRIYDRAIKP